MSIFDWASINQEVQIDEYHVKIAPISKGEKTSLLLDLISDYSLLVHYEDIFAELIFDIAFDDYEFIDILKKELIKFNSDLVSGNIFKPFVRIGRDKKEIASNICKKIETSGDEKLIELSGHFIGGMYEDEPEKFFHSIESDIGSNESFVLANIKALRIVCNKLNEMPYNLFDIIDNFIEKNNERINIQLIHLCFDNYLKETNKFFELLRLFATIDIPSYKTTICFRMFVLDNLKEDHLFHLIHICKDDDESLDDICRLLVKHPHRTDDIIKIIFFWLLNKKIWQIQSINWTISSIAKDNQKIVESYINYYSKMSCKNGVASEPFLFEHFIIDPSVAVTGIEKLSSDNDIERDIIFKLINVVIGECYNDVKHFTTIRKIGDILLKYNNTPFIDCQINSKFLGESSLQKDRYDALINSFSSFIDNMRDLPRSYDFNIIYKNLEKYPTIKKFSYGSLKICEMNEKYCHLLHFLTNTTDNQNQAYLNELELCLKFYGNMPNDKYPTIENKIKYFKDVLKDNNAFWKFFSELVFGSKIGVDYISCKDKIINKNDLDYEMHIECANIYLEVTSPEYPRESRISNSASYLKSKTMGAIDHKYTQMIKSGLHNSIEQNDDVYYYVVIDGSNLPLFSIDAAEAVFGPLSITTTYNKSKEIIHECLSKPYKESIWPKNEKFKYISGVIIFKREFIRNSDGKCSVGLVGTIFNNPKGKNVLSKVLIEKLKSLLFFKEMGTN